MGSHSQIILKSSSCHPGDGKRILLTFTHRHSHKTHPRVTNPLFHALKYSQLTCEIKIHSLANHRRTYFVSLHSHSVFLFVPPTHLIKGTAKSKHPQSPDRSAVVLIHSYQSFFQPLVLLLNLIPVDGSSGEHLGERCAILQVIHDPVQGNEGEKQVNYIS